VVAYMNAWLWFEGWELIEEIEEVQRKEQR
jgi:hypothetical protein